MYPDWIESIYVLPFFYLSPQPNGTVEDKQKSTPHDSPGDAPDCVQDPQCLKMVQVNNGFVDRVSRQELLKTKETK